MEYQHVIKNELKLKGSSKVSFRYGRHQKKKKKTNRDKLKNSEYLNHQESGDQSDPTTLNSPSLQHSTEINTDPLPGSHNNPETLLNDVIDPTESLTLAEKTFRLAQKKREMLRTNRRLELTHRQRMERFNAQLRALPEHFDIPKVGPG